MFSISLYIFSNCALWGVLHFYHYVGIVSCMERLESVSCILHFRSGFQTFCILVWHCNLDLLYLMVKLVFYCNLV